MTYLWWSYPIHPHEHFLSLLVLCNSFHVRWNSFPRSHVFNLINASSESRSGECVDLAADHIHVHITTTHPVNRKKTLTILGSRQKFVLAWLITQREPVRLHTIPRFRIMSATLLPWVVDPRSYRAYPSTFVLIMIYKRPYFWEVVNPVWLEND